jgi:preprotein translocase subunit SecA
MIQTVLQKIFGTRNEREVKRLAQVVDQVNALEPSVRPLSDADLKARTPLLKNQIEQETPLEEILPEAFAVVREASRRIVGMRHFDVQLIGGAVLFEGTIAEMKTGEGKTLVATLPAYLYGLTGRGVHIVTVNDYLARRDASWMGPIFKFLGLTVGAIGHDAAFLLEWEDEAAGTVKLVPCRRREAYAADITYGQNNEFGFDYLRDNMVPELSECVQRKLHYAVVDEVDSILIDEARTPLIISGASEDSTDKYYQIDRILPKLKRDADFTIDEKAKSVTMSEAGVTHVEKLLGVDNLYDARNIELVHHVQQGLKAHQLFHRDVDYVVKDGQVVIVDEFTGRLMPGRRWSDGLHQAVEAKEGVKIERENQTLATITFQNYFRMYERLSGMTGTAATEATEFAQIYGLEVLTIPTNRELIRTEYPDVVFRTIREKHEAVVEEIVALHEAGRPVLVGTVSIERSELLAGMLSRRGVKHHVLNAKHHEREAEIIARAGQLGQVTIATNMAGRGTDIILGQGVTDLGGLHIIGTERHESRRIDNQLRGRAGRQGDPGSSRFYLSLEDDLIRIFGGDRIGVWMDRLGMEEGQPIEHRWLTKAIENAQKRVEGHNYDIRKHLLEYDDVMNKQREVIYERRRQILEGADTREVVDEWIEEFVAERVEAFAPSPNDPDDWDLQALGDQFRSIFDVDSTGVDITAARDREALTDILLSRVKERYAQREHLLSTEHSRWLERMVMLQVLDSQWKDHLLSMDNLKEGIGYRAYAQKNPLIEYKNEGFSLFAEMMDRVREAVLTYLFRIQIGTAPAEQSPLPTRPRKPAGEAVHRSFGYGVADKEYLSSAAPAPGEPRPSPRTESAPPKPSPHHSNGTKVGRNDPCPCGSGKKYKKCCGNSP